MPRGLHRAAAGRAMRWLPVHPVPMKAVFRRCYLVNFAVEPAALRRRLPAHLEPDLHDGRAWLSIVIADMTGMRPAFLPAALGFDFTQAVYRAVVRCGAERGVAFLRSDADDRLMVAAGNALTFFRFHHASVRWDSSPDLVRLALVPSSGKGARIEAAFDRAVPGDRLPSMSRFADLASASSFLSELYTAYGARRADGRVEVVRIARTPWQSRVVDATGSFEAMGSGAVFDAGECALDSAFEVENLDYRWNRLSLEQPAQGGVQARLTGRASTRP